MTDSDKSLCNPENIQFTSDNTKCVFNMSMGSLSPSPGFARGRQPAMNGVRN